MFIYKIYCKGNKKCYIGQTLNYKQRVCYHKTYLRRKVHSNRLLQRAFNKYGEESFEFSILEQCKDLGTLNEREIYWIGFYKATSRGFNIQLGGHSDRPSERGLKKLREKARRQNKAVIQYDLNGNLIEEFESIKLAAYKVECSSSEIMRVCKGENEQSKGYQWRYKGCTRVVNQVLSLKDKSSRHFKKYNVETKSKIVIQKTLTGQFVAKYKSIANAVAINLFKNSSMITNCLTKRLYCKSAYGYLWEYKDSAN